MNTLSKQILLLLTLTVTLTASTQEYTSGTLSNSSAGFNLLFRHKTEYYGFGVSFFRDKGTKGQDYTNFIQPNSDVYETLSSQFGSIYGLVGKRYKTGIVTLRLGLGTRKWVYNGKTGSTYWYIVRDGGTYLLYGAEYRKLFNRVYIGASYDNFNRAGLIVGYTIGKISYK